MYEDRNTFVGSYLGSAQIVPYKQQKHHPIPTDALPNASDALLVISSSTRPPPPPLIVNFNAFVIFIVEINAYFFRSNQCVSNALILAITIVASFYLESQGFFYIGFADGVYPEILFIILEEIYCLFSNEVEFGCMGFDFLHLRGYFGHLGVAFGFPGVYS